MTRETASIQANRAELRACAPDQRGYSAAALVRQGAPAADVAEYLATLGERAALDAVIH